MDDSQRLAELLHTTQVAVVAITVLSDGDIELDLAVSVVGRSLADIPGDAGATEHDAGVGEVEGVLGGDHTDAHGTGFPDAVIGEELFDLVNAVAELGCPLVDVIEEADGEVLVDSAGADVGGVETGAGDALVEFLLRLGIFLVGLRGAGVP